MSTIQSELKKLAAQPGWSVERVVNKIHKLQAIEIGKNSLPWCMMAEPNQKVIACLTGPPNGAVDILCDQPTIWTKLYSSNLFDSCIYRINPGFLPPDLSETPPRFPYGSWVAVTTNGAYYLAVDPQETSCRDEMRPGEFVIQYQGNPDAPFCKCASWAGDHYQPLPPRPELDGWEIVRAAKIDGTQKLADGEHWVSWSGNLCGVYELAGAVTYAHNKQWRWVARKEESKDLVLKYNKRFPGSPSQPPIWNRSMEERLMYDAIHGTRHAEGVCEEKQEPQEKVEYVDYEVKPYGPCDALAAHNDDGEMVAWITDCLELPEFIACVYADGTGSQIPRKPATNWKPALIPTHVRMAKEAE